jgi:hypothetical protein
MKFIAFIWLKIVSTVGFLYGTEELLVTITQTT